MPKDRSMNQKLSDMHINNEAAEESFEQRVSELLEGDEGSIPAIKIEKNEPPMLHKNFFNGFIDFFAPYHTKSK